MKLFKSQKKNAGSNHAQDLYPKVKTYSKAYDFSPQKEQAPAAVPVDAPFFIPDGRPYPAAVPPADLPEIPNKAEEFNDPERIDLQDTLLTDESFAGRPMKQSASVPAGFTADEPAEQEETEPVPAAVEDPWFPETEEPEETPETDEEDDFRETDEPEPFEAEIPEENEEDVPEPFFSPEADEEDSDAPFFVPEPEDETESLRGSGPETGSGADPFPGPDEDTDTEPGLFPESGPEDVPGPAKDSAEDSAGAFSWFDTDTDPLPEDPKRIAFRKKKYTVVIGKKKNLKKKLVSKPEGSLKWKSSNKKIAKISRKGVLKPKKKGKVTIRVKAKGGKRGKVKILVRSVKKQKALPWERVGTEKKAISDKKWARFA